jgi:hypothetical protein
MLFHRLQVPSYFGGLPSGYDYVNNATAGTPAFADTQKVGGPNAGTYFIGFGEDATSADANRPALALAQNTDYLDNLMRRDIALPVRSSDATGAPTSTIVVTGPGVFMGLTGAALKDLFHFTDTNDEDLDVAGTKVFVASAVDSGSVAVGGGFSAGNVTLTLNIPIPSGQAYRFYYGQRTNWATFPADGLTSTRIRNLTEVDYQVEELFRLLHGNNEAWNAAWDSTVYDLAASGLNERYSRSQVTSTLAGPEGYWPAALSTAGSGGWVRRTGPALTVYSGGDSSPLSDPLNALFAAKNVDTSPANSGGIVGYAAYGSRLSGTANAAESVHARTPGGALFLGLWPHDFSSDTNFFTNISAGASVTLSNVGSYDLNTGTAKVALSASLAYFRTSSASSISVGYDLLELSWVQGSTTVYQTFVIVSLDISDPKVAYVRHMNGTVPDWTTVVPTGATARWVSTSFGVGDGASAYHQVKYGYPSSDAVLLDGLFYQVPPVISSSGADNNVTRTPPSFSAQDNSNRSTALQWGGFNSALFGPGPQFTGLLGGDGSITANGPSFFLNGITVTVTSANPGAAVIATAFGAGNPGGFFTGAHDTVTPGAGVTGFGGGGAAVGAYGVNGIGSGTSAGVNGLGGTGGGAGVYGTAGVGGYGGYFTTVPNGGAGTAVYGISFGGIGGEFYAGGTGDGVFTLGASVGNGVRASGGNGASTNGSSKAAGLHGIGGSSGAYGVYGQGTSSFAGVYGTSSGTGPGGEFLGGTNGIGVKGTGVGGAAGGYFAAGSSSLVALQAHGGAVYVDTDVANSTVDPGSNNLWASNFTKFWGAGHTNGSGGIAVDSGVGWSQTITSGATMNVAFARNMANDFYHVDVTVAVDGTTHAVSTAIFNKAQGGFSFQAWDVVANSAVFFNSQATHYSYNVVGLTV